MLDFEHQPIIPIMFLIIKTEVHNSGVITVKTCNTDIILLMYMKGFVLKFWTSLWINVISLLFSVYLFYYMMTKIFSDYFGAHMTVDFKRILQQPMTFRVSQWHYYFNNPLLLSFGLYDLSVLLYNHPYDMTSLHLQLKQIGDGGRHGGTVVTHLHPTSETRIWLPTRPHVKKLAVACHWLAVYSKEPWPTVCTGFLCPSY